LFVNAAIERPAAATARQIQELVPRQHEPWPLQQRDKQADLGGARQHSDAITTGQLAPGIQYPPAKGVARRGNLAVPRQRIGASQPRATHPHKHGTRVSGAAAAWASLAKNTIDLTVLDVMMPDEDGLSWSGHIREAHDTSVTLLTAMRRIVGLEIDADRSVVKPCNPRELLARVKDVLSGVAVVADHQNVELTDS
jgi:CheY-like chemotaxis protein